MIYYLVTFVNRMLLWNDVINLVNAFLSLVANLIYFATYLHRCSLLSNQIFIQSLATRMSNQI
jgi:hypothetical protein